MNHPNPTAELIERITRREFNPLRIATPKSDPYIEGFRAGLTKQLEHRDLPQPYKPGTADADAYLAGKHEGRDFDLGTPLEIHETASAKA